MDDQIKEKYKEEMERKRFERKYTRELEKKLFKYFLKETKDYYEEILNDYNMNKIKEYIENNIYRINYSEVESVIDKAYYDIYYRSFCKYPSVYPKDKKRVEDCKKDELATYIDCRSKCISIVQNNKEILNFIENSSIGHYEAKYFDEINKKINSFKENLEILDDNKRNYTLKIVKNIINALFYRFKDMVDNCLGDAWESCKNKLTYSSKIHEEHIEKDFLSQFTKKIDCDEEKAKNNVENSAIFYFSTFIDLRNELYVALRNKISLLEFLENPYKLIETHITTEFHIMYLYEKEDAVKLLGININGKYRNYRRK